MPGTSGSARASSSNPEARICTPSSSSSSCSSFLLPVLLFVCGVGASRGHLVRIPVSLSDSFRSLSSGSRFRSGIRIATAAAAATAAASAATRFWTPTSSATTRALEPLRVLQQTSPPTPRLTGHRLHPRHDLGIGVRRLSLAEMSGVSGDAAAVSASSGAGDLGKNGQLRSSLPTVMLDADAVQKFAEIELRWGGDDESAKPTVLIRGLESAVFHKDAARPTMELLRKAGERPAITGGGRIKHSTQKRTIFVYGYSIEFGRADLPRVAELCQAAYPDYEVTWSSGGY